MNSAILFLLAACSGPGPANPVASHSAEDTSVFNSLATMRVKELFIVLFEKDFSEQEWQTIFDETNQISLNKKKLREFEGLTDAASQAARAEVIGKNSELFLVQADLIGQIGRAHV